MNFIQTKAVNLSFSVFNEFPLSIWFLIIYLLLNIPFILIKCNFDLILFIILNYLSIILCNGLFRIFLPILIIQESFNYLSS